MAEVVGGTVWMMMTTLVAEKRWNLEVVQRTTVWMMMTTLVAEMRWNLEVVQRTELQKKVFVAEGVQICFLP